ncbi:tripartite tricarboxylate transporter substrate binding protein [Roseomonas sp. PWR1]|uniref:Tripartite tricarboxylate transporter substrate binding protein n=1 Tax=Roseomonas nitratireducens TaxID=2820810 RepID=A0ABS4AXS6_9PROT|nr:tripartite tricarboxylate transporter substrate binding protein [Neoroseomonas nitratireducens]MBP0466186.1 tripartite tricarboxylate transporter substrate binding protein [Neoroseomonas nitratireducens]
MITRRTTFALAGAMGLPAAARAQESWPSRPVTLVVPWAAGGSTDAVARILAQRLTQDTGRSFVVDNRTGANGTIGFNSVARARPDGTTLLVSTVSTYAMAPWLYQLPYDNERDLMGIGLLAAMPIIMVVNKDFPARTLAEFVELARRPGHRITYANSGAGSSTHLATELFLQEARLEIPDIGYRGGAPAVQAVLANETPMVFQAASGILPHIQSGAFRALGVASPQRSPLAPEIPTFAEQGFPGVIVEEHIALQAPAGLPAEIVQRAHQAAKAAMEAAETRQRLATLAVVPTVTAPEAWPAYFAAENAKWRDMIRARNIRVQ